jgi:hypothetical protein
VQVSGVLSNVIGDDLLDDEDGPGAVLERLGESQQLFLL